MAILNIAIDFGMDHNRQNIDSWFIDKKKLSHIAIIGSKFIIQNMNHGFK